jgi:histidyl-tRNA synthetase
LDYYNKTVFEWTTQHLGAQSAVCGGGRYDSLVEQLGGEYTSATGFAIGLERLVLLLEMQRPQLSQLAAYLICTGEAQNRKLLLAQKIREKFANLALIMHLPENTNFRNQFKKADKSGAQLAFIVGDDELANGEVSIKYLRVEKPQISVKLQDLSYSHLEDC